MPWSGLELKGITVSLFPEGGGDNLSDPSHDNREMYHDCYAQLPWIGIYISEQCENADFKILLEETATVFIPGKHL